VQRKGLIVIHEGDDLIRELLERWLGEAGYCLRAAGDEAPCLVIADVPSPRGAQPMIGPCMLRPSWSCRGASGAASADLPKQRAGSA
jgi:hypothetical protein